ncbi:MAG: hypothetical protein IOC52_05765 [Methylobacterium sp.]|jgi:hypothetical protein|nr:hypothetical protein [Methylobacterium sp.]MCA3623671.1 hypothetical protein [Methylobacterium sp.]
MDPLHIDSLIRKLLVPVDGQSHPNMGALRRALKDLDAIKINIKMSGYTLAERLAGEIKPRTGLKPYPISLQCKPSTQADLQADWAAYWLGQLHIPVLFHRKFWEFAYVLQVLWQSGMLEASRKGLGFGCGVEPLPSYLASCGVDALVTDLAPEAMADAGWTGTNQHTHSLDAAYHAHLVERAKFDRHVTHRYLDMRDIPSDLKGFDFCWSICALEHLGSIRNGLDFVKASLAPLAPGGIAVHTTEFNYLSDEETLDNWPTVLFQRRHFEALAQDLIAQGHEVAPLNFNIGRDPLDFFVDIPPFAGDWTEYQKSIFPNPTHIKLSIDGFASTCFGLFIRKRQ